MPTIDLNADLGESFGPWTMGADGEMLMLLTSANVACGGHASDPTTMDETLRLATKNGVCVGAHPGFDDKEGFGRRRLPLTAAEVERLVAAQVGTLKGVAALSETPVRYVKAHGALANWAAEEGAIADAVARAVRAHGGMALLAISGTELERAGKQHGLETYSEIFADRGYGDNGLLVPRSEPGALITDAKAACARLVRFFETGAMPTASGGTVKLDAHSICIHGDNPQAVALGRSVRDGLAAEGFTFRAFCDG